MTTTTGTTGPTGAGPATAPGRTTANELGIDKDAFLQLLVAQVRYQDPTRPLDNAEFLTQTAQFSVVEQLSKLSEAQAEMIAFQRVLLSTDLVGRAVEGVTLEGLPVSGTVDAVRITGGQAWIVVGDKEIPVDHVSVISANPTSAEPPQSDGSGTKTPEPPDDEPAAGSGSGT